MKWVHIAEKACKSPIKRKKDWPTTLVCSKFYFSAFYDSYVFSYEFNKGLECSKSSIEIVYHLLIWAMRETPIYYLCLLSLFFLFIFFFSMPRNFCPWHPLMNFCHAHGLFLSLTLSLLLFAHDRWLWLRVDFDRWIFARVDFCSPGAPYPFFHVDFIFAVYFCIFCF